MSANIVRFVKFYDFAYGTGERQLFTFRVENELDARKALVRFNVKAGYYEERNRYSGKVIKNYKILPYDGR